MNRERWIGVAVVLLVVGGFLMLRGGNGQGLDEAALGEGIEIEERASEFAKQMGVTLPEDVEKASLADVSGGEGSGIATRDFVEGSFSHSVLAAVPEPVAGSWYEGWLVRPDPFDVVYTGKLRVAKGGWVLDYTANEDLTDHTQVVVTLEKVDDQKPEAHILEGSF